MLIEDQQLLFYQRCHRRAFLDVYGDRTQKEPPSDFLLKLIADSGTYRKTVLGDRAYSQPEYPYKDWEAGVQATLELMKQGVDRIYGGVLLFHTGRPPAQLPEAEAGDLYSPPYQEGAGAINSPPYQGGAGAIDSPPYQGGAGGDLSPQISDLILESDRDFLSRLPDGITLLSHPDLLVKKTGVSIVGDWTYIPQDIRLGKRPKLDYQLVAALHAQILAWLQGTTPDRSVLLLRDRRPYSVNLKQRLPQLHEIILDYITMLRERREPEIFISRQKCSLCQWHADCHAIAKSQNHLCLLPGITPNRQARLEALNLTTVESLAQSSPEVLNPYPEFENDVAQQVIRQAEAVWQNRAILRTESEGDGNGTIPHQNNSRNGSEPDPFWLQAPVELYFDIEAQPDLNLDYLHGVLVVDRRSQTETFYPLLAETVADEEAMWEQFLTLVWRYPIAPIFHFCDYEAKTIARLAKLYNTPAYLWRPLMKRLVDIHYQVVQTVTLPVESYALKSIARWMGFEWRDGKANGAQCVCWYEQWLKTGDRTLLDAIVRYNEDDCRATYHVKRWLADFVQN